MRTVLDELIDRIADRPVAMARVVTATGAGPAAPGVTMLVTAAGAVVGSLSGGCVESAVCHVAGEVIGTGVATTDRFGAVADDGPEIGLPCGGEIEIFVERVDATRLPLLRAVRQAIRAGEPIALASTLTADSGWTLLRTDDNDPWRGVDRDARALLRAGRCDVVGAPEDGHRPDAPSRPRTFVQVFAAPPRMILAGANEYVRALACTARALGYRVTVVDARAGFATPARFPDAHEVIVDWPHRYLDAEIAAGRIDRTTVVCVMTHDPKFDVPALATALGTNAAFIGALGSRRAHADRLTRLRAAGVTEADLTGLRSPLGLDLNARTPEDTAISIAAHILAIRDGGSARPLDDLEGPIHH